MRPFRVSDDLVSVSEFKAQTAAWLGRAARTGQPVVITQHGKAAGVVLSPAVYDLLVERSRFVAAVQEGLADAAAGRTFEHATVVNEVKRRFGRTAKK